MDDYVDIEGLCDHFRASRTWVYKYLVPAINSERVKVTMPDDRVRSYRIFDATDALRVFADAVQVEVYSVPCDSSPRDTGGYAHYRRPHRVRIKTSEYVRQYIEGGGQLWRASDLGFNSTEQAYQYIYKNAWYALTFGNKTWFIPRDRDPKFVVPAIVKYGRSAHAVEYARGGRKRSAAEPGTSAAVNAALDAPVRV